MTPIPNRTRRAVVAPLALALALAGCSAGDDAPAPEAADATVAGTPDEGASVEVELVDFAFVGLPDTVERGTRLAVSNGAESELHELVAFALPDDEDRPVEELVAVPPEELVGTLGEPAAVLLAAPGGPQIPAVGDGTLSEPGRYAIVCLIPTGVDPQVYLDAAAEGGEGPPQVDGGGPPHLVHGMHAELEVT